MRYPLSGCYLLFSYININSTGTIANQIQEAYNACSFLSP
jgi:hypothetical protein